MKTETKKSPSDLQPSGTCLPVTAHAFCFHCLANGKYDVKNTMGQAVFPDCIDGDAHRVADDDFPGPRIRYYHPECCPVCRAEKH
jgi:hypothetical protein